jgi:gliding motility-associated-like protein
MICLGDAAQLQATGAVSYTWLNPTTNLSCTDCPNPVATPTRDIQYIVQGTSGLGCSSNDTVLVKVFQPYTLSVSPIEDSVCLGKSVQLKATGSPLYAWSPANGLSATNISNPIATPDTSIVYKVVGYDSLGCFADSAIITLKTLQNPTIDVGPDITLGAGSTANLNVSSSSNVVSYSWSPSIGLSCTNCQNPIVTGGDNVTYVVKATTASGCSATDQLKVIVTCNDANIFVPNTFTPNGDGMNDVFYVRGNGIFAVKSLRIFNRWGEVVFEKKDLTANDPLHGWNGMYKGQKAPTETYIYQLEVLCTNRQVLKYNGTISLVQ